MNAKKTVATNTLYQLFAKVISTITTLGISIYITRLLGASTWGEYSIVIAYVSFFYAFTEFGLNGIAARDFSEKEEITKKDFFNFFAVRAINTIIVIGLGLIFLQFFSYSKNIKLAIYINFIGIIFFSLSSSFNAVFQAKLLYKYLFYITFIFSFFYISFFVYFTNFIGNSLIFLIIPMILADLIRFIFAGYFGIRLLSKDSVVIVKEKMRYYFITAAPLGIALIFNTLMVQIDRLMLSVMVSEVQVGYYSLSYKLFDVLLVIPTFFINATFPIWVKRFKKNGNYNKEFSTSVFGLLVMSLLITAISLSVGWFFIPLIWGIDMQPAIVVFNILITGAFLFYLSSPISWSFVVEDKQKYLILFYFFGFLLNLTLNFLLIETFNYGYIGAAYATLTTELFVVILLETYRRRYLKVEYILPDFKGFYTILLKNEK